jgi:hypothetical protein
VVGTTVELVEGKEADGQVGSAAATIAGIGVSVDDEIATIPLRRIVVGVVLETVREIEAQMTMRNFKGFLE